MNPETETLSYFVIQRVAYRRTHQNVFVEIVTGMATVTGTVITYNTLVIEVEVEVLLKDEGR